VTADPVRETAAAERAIVLTRAVRDADPARVHALLAEYSAALPDVVVVLADRVRTLEALARRLDADLRAARAAVVPKPGAGLRAAHAAYEAAREAGRLTPALRAGDRDYQRETKRAASTRGQQGRRGTEVGRCVVCGREFRVCSDGSPWRHKDGEQTCAGSDMAAERRSA